MRVNGLLLERRVGEAHELERLHREPHARIGVYQIPDRINHIVARAETTAALAVRLTGHLNPQEGVDQLVAGVGSGANANTTAGRVAPCLRVGEGLRWRPRTLAVPAGVDDEVRGRLGLSKDQLVARVDAGGVRLGSTAESLQMLAASSATPVWLFAGPPLQYWLPQLSKSPGCTCVT